jgi:beta-galactosidase
MRAAKRPVGATAALALAPVATLFAVHLAAAGASPVSPEPPPRERASIDYGWRFQKGDPAGSSASLSYDVRPVTEESGGSGAPDRSAQAVLKPWILPTGNRFIQDPARRFERPEGNPGGDVAYVQLDFDDSSWRLVDLPHDWAIEGPFQPTGPGGGMGRLPSAGVGWYRRKLEIPAEDAGRSIFLDVDGAMSYAAVWLNGRLVGGWPFGYASWRVDLTPHVRPGETNQLAIRLDNPPDSSRWYPGGGLYRHVWLTKTGPVHVAQWGTYLRTREVSTSSAAIDLEVTIDNHSEQDAPIVVETAIHALDREGRRSGEAVARIDAAEAVVPAGGSASVDGSVTLSDPRLWGPPPSQQPNLYVALTTVTHQGGLADRHETRFGIRDLRFDPDWGVYVNGERVYLAGVNLHHDLGALGAAFNRRAAERQLEKLREMGCNAIRVSHNPPAPELLELTDAMGFLVMDEAFDVWARRKTPLDFHLIFEDWHEQDLRALIRRDRNSPSVILWSIGNEPSEQYTEEGGAEWGRRLHEIAGDEDPTRPTTTAMNRAQAPDPLPGIVDVISLNYQGAGVRSAPSRFPEFRERHPRKLVLSSETAAAVSSRGVHLFPVAGGVGGPVRPGYGGDPEARHVSAYELHAADFGSSADRVFASQERNPWVAGEFVWTGWDYLGEPTPYYESRSSYFGIIDLAGFEKDRFYLYQAHWRPDHPMAHIVPHWTWPERVGQATPVHVFTSGDEAELFLNGRSLGRRAEEPYQYRLRWDDVVYEPGTLELVAYKGGRRWATDRVSTTQPPAALDALPDRQVIRADGRDVAFVTVRVVDAGGRLAPRADDRIELAIEGPGEIVATDNGDPTSFEPFQSPSRKAFNGLCLAIVRGKPGETGRIMLTASSEGLRNGTTFITTVATTRD